MKKYFCDICGKEMLIVPITVKDIKECDYTVYRNDKYGKHILDLCDTCSSNLTSLILKQGVKENE